MFSITMCRQQAELDFVRLGLKRKKEKAEQGWFGGWFGGGKKKEEKEKGQLDDIAGMLFSISCDITSIFIILPHQHVATGSKQTNRSINQMITQVIQ